MITISLPLVDIEETRNGNEVLVQVYASRLLVPTPETVEVIKVALMERYRNFNIIEEDWAILISPLTGTLRLKANAENDDGERLPSQIDEQKANVDVQTLPSLNDNEGLSLVSSTTSGAYNAPSLVVDGNDENKRFSTLQPSLVVDGNDENKQSPNNVGDVPLILNDENDDLITYSSKPPYEINNGESNDLIVHDPRDTTSRNLGAEGEAEVYNRLVNLFPKLEVKLVSEVAHVADIHIIDEIRNITFIVEVKNKTRLTAEDIDKFKRDLVDMSKANTNRVIGLFISLICPIPRLGLVNIGTDSCYLAKEYTSDMCIDLVVKTYRSVYTKRETTTKTNSVKYEIPINVYKLLSELRMQSAAIESAKEIYCKQIEINKQSSANMYDLLAKADMQKHLIDFINNEFGDVVGSVNIVNNDEELLRDYLSSRTRKTIRQRDIRSLFPSITSTLTLDEIWARYGPQ